MHQVRYLSLGLGGIIGAVISWRIYNTQKKTSVKQDETLRRINELEESHDQEKLLSKILTLDKKIDAIVNANKEN